MVGVNNIARVKFWIGPMMIRIRVFSMMVLLVVMGSKRKVNVWRK